MQETLKSYEAPEDYQLPESVPLSQEEMQGLMTSAKQVGLIRSLIKRGIRTRGR